MDLYIKPIEIYGKWLGMVGKWLGCIQPMCSAPGHSWQGPFFCQKSAPFHKKCLFGCFYCKIIVQEGLVVHHKFSFVLAQPFRIERKVQTSSKA